MYKYANPYEVMYSGIYMSNQIQLQMAQDNEQCAQQLAHIYAVRTQIQVNKSKITF